MSIKDKVVMPAETISAVSPELRRAESNVSQRITRGVLNDLLSQEISIEINKHKCSKCHEVNDAWDMMHNSEIDRVDGSEMEFNPKWEWLCSHCFE